jgi:hypothetical protein
MAAVLAERQHGERAGAAEPPLNTQELTRTECPRHSIAQYIFGDTMETYSGELVTPFKWRLKLLLEAAAQATGRVPQPERLQLAPKDFCI